MSQRSGTSASKRPDESTKSPTAPRQPSKITKKPTTKESKKGKTRRSSQLDPTSKQRGEALLATFRQLSLSESQNSGIWTASSVGSASTGRPLSPPKKPSSASQAGQTGEVAQLVNVSPLRRDPLGTMQHPRTGTPPPLSLGSAESDSDQMDISPK